MPANLNEKCVIRLFDRCGTIDKYVLNTLLSLLL